MPYASREKQLEYFKAYNAKRREEIKEYMHEYNRSRDPEVRRAQGKIYREKYGEALYAKRREQRANDPESFLTRERRYYYKNKAARDAKFVEWKKVHKDRIRVYDQKRKAAILNAPVNDFSGEQWAIMKLVYGYKCTYCNDFTKNLTQDHIIPLSKGGSHTASNIVPSCQRCNSKKGVKEPLDILYTYPVNTECA